MSPQLIALYSAISYAVCIIAARIHQPYVALARDSSFSAGSRESQRPNPAGLVLCCGWDCYYLSGKLGLDVCLRWPLDHLHNRAR